MVIFGIGATLPIFYIGSNIGLALGPVKACLAILLSCLLVSMLMLATSIIGARIRLSTYMLVQLSFGRVVARVINLLMFVMLIGYFSVTAEIFGGAISDMLKACLDIDWPPAIFVIVGGILMSLTAIFGFGILERFSAIAVPLLAVFMLVVLVVALLAGSDNLVSAPSGKVEPLTVGTAISTVIGANILMAVAGPDFARFARDDREAAKSVTGLLLGFPIIMFATAIPSVVTGQVDVMKIMLALSLAIPAFVVLSIATWTTNTVNVYSAALALAAVFPRIPQIRLAVFSCATGIVGAAIGVLHFFLDFAIYLGLIATPIAGVYVVDFFVLRQSAYYGDSVHKVKRIRWSATLAWIAGATWAICAFQLTMSQTGVAALDGLLLAMLGYALIGQLTKDDHGAR